MPPHKSSRHQSPALSLRSKRNTRDNPAWSSIPMIPNFNTPTTTRSPIETPGFIVVYKLPDTFISLALYANIVSLDIGCIQPPTAAPRLVHDRAVAPLGVFTTVTR